MGAGESGRFSQTQEEANSHNALRVMDSGSDHCESTPEQHHGREEDSGGEVIKSEIGGDLADDITDQV